MGKNTMMRRSIRLYCERTGNDHWLCLLDHLIGEARRRGYRRLSLETGVGPAFAPALALYRRGGFVGGEAFADYRPSPFNQFMHLAL